MRKPYKECSIDGCKGNVRSGGARGLCAKHYLRWKRNGSPHATKYETGHAGQPCSVDGCNETRISRGYCSHHYEKWKSFGDPKHVWRGKKEQWLEDHRSWESDDCLIWPFTVGDHGRGVATLGGKMMSAPKAMCILAHGEPPTSRHTAAHSCGKGHMGCMNPKHLSWKTPTENEADKVLHGTVVRGEKVNTNKLSEVEVLEILQDGDKTSGAELADRYGVSRTTISRIRRRKSWAWLRV